MWVKRVVFEEDDGGGIIGLIFVIVLVAFLLYILLWIGVACGLGYGIYRLVKYIRKQRALKPTRCPKCKKKNALEYYKSRVMKRCPVQKNIINKNTGKKENVAMLEITTRNYEKCKYCGEIIFYDKLTKEIDTVG